MGLAQEYAKILTSGLFQTRAYWSQLRAIPVRLFLAYLKLLGGLHSLFWLKKWQFLEVVCFWGLLSATAAGGTELDIEANSEVRFDR